MKKNEKEAIIKLLGGLGLIVMLIGLFTNAYEFMHGLIAAIAIWILSGVIANILVLKKARGDSMGFAAWIEGVMKKLKWYDMSLIKLSTAAFILMIAVLWPTLLDLDWYWYLIIAVILAIHPMIMGFKK